MKKLIVYYSMEGNTEYVVDKIKGKLEADTLRLIPKKAYHDKGLAKFLWGGKSAMMAEKPELEDYSVNLENYDMIIFGFPVWASNITPPLRTFIEDNKEALKGKQFAAFACQSGGGAQKAFTKLAKCLDISELSRTAVFIDPKARASAETDKQIEAYMSRSFFSNSI